MGERRSHRDDVVAILKDERVAALFIKAQDLLKNHLVHTREILNGSDFLFLGPERELHDALKLIVDVEHKSSQFLHIDFAQVDEYFLLRLVGSETSRHVISSYFD